MNMKMNKTRTIVALLLVIPGVLCAQGTIDFRNRVIGSLDAPVYNPLTGANVGNPDVVAQLYYSSSPSGNFVSVSDPPAPLRSGAGAGYWNPGPSATRVLDGIAPGEIAYLQVRVWNAAQYETFEEAFASNGNWVRSEIFLVTTGGAGSPPTLPAVIDGLTPIPYIPEPGTFSLGVLGGMVMVFLGWRRKKR